MGMVKGRSAWVGGAMGLLLGLLVAGCPQASSFECQSDDQCLDGTNAGRCTELGYCAFEDEACESGWAFGDLAGGGLAGECVSDDGGTGTSAGGQTVTSASGTTGPLDDTGPFDDSGPAGDCASGSGAPCTPDDPCAAAGVCDEQGDCLPTEMIECTDAPNDSCYLPIGQCEDGRCYYTAQSREFPCEDGNPCTMGDFCDGQGECAPGPECPVAQGPCIMKSTCTPEGCSFEFMPNGTACGGPDSERCCEGTCVDIANSDDHCGGCDSTCEDAYGCMPIDEIPFCGAGAESGRCGCELDDDCPQDQTCVMTNFGTLRCIPNSDRQCDGDVMLEEDCDNYCGYP